MNLLIDIGNTRVKWAIENDEIITHHGQFNYQQNSIAGELDTIASGMSQPDAIAVTSVADKGIVNTCLVAIKNIWGREPWFSKVETTACGVSSGYSDITQLGIDRWLGIISAWNTYQNVVCVIDCGTAITVDYVDAAGQHQGGLIIPGLDMMQAMLINNTANINAKITNVFSLQAGNDTQSCISNGCALAVIGFLEQAVRHINSSTETEPEYILTGGSAALIGPHLSFQTHFDEMLVLKGLSVLLRNRS